MGSFTAQVQSPQTTQPPQPAGKGAASSMIARDVNQRVDGLDQNAINADPSGYESWQQQANQAGYNYGPGNTGVAGHPISQNASPQGKGASTNSATSGQPRMGQPNNYANTVGGWDNASIQPQRSGGKGKGY